MFMHGIFNRMKGSVKGKCLPRASNSHATPMSRVFHGLIYILMHSRALFPLKMEAMLHS